MTREMKLKVKSVSPMNEPNTNYWPAMNYKQEGCHIDAGESQSKLLVLTKEALNRYGLKDIILTTSDETNPGKQIEEIRTLTPDARAAIDRISVHTYGTNSIREMGQLAKDEKINLWMSEVDGNGTAGQNAGEMAAGLWLAEKIITDIEALEPSAWVLWQVIDTHISKDGYMGRRDGGPLRTHGGYWGTACANHDTGEILLTQKYYAMGQFTRYIRPGSTLILCPTDRRSGVKALAAINKKQLTIVCTNTTDQEKDLTIDLSEFKPKGSVKQIRTAGQFADGEHWAETTLPKAKSSTLSVSLAPNSVTTYIVACK
jgi:O-glycosyl hydrolase